jgi:DNA-directed RNA polymerase III subunit RPC2
MPIEPSSVGRDAADDETQTPLVDLPNQWLLVPAFLRVRGLVRQHIDSFNYFINVEIKKILAANDRLLCDADPAWSAAVRAHTYTPCRYLRYISIDVGEPTVSDGPGMPDKQLTPHMSRLRDMTYSAPITVCVCVRAHTITN